MESAEGLLAFSWDDILFVDPLLHHWFFYDLDLN